MGCKLPTVNKFLCCLELETGGIIVGWLTAIFAVIGAIAMTASLVVVLWAFDQLANKQDSDITAIIVLSVIFGIYIIYLCLVICAAVLLIRGTRNRNPGQLKPYLFLSAIGVVISFLQIFSAGNAGIAGAIVSAILAAYFFICIYSLYDMLKGGQN